MKVMKMKHMYVLAMVILVGTVAADLATNTCSHTCGGQEIQYPFAINDTSSDSDCFLGGKLIPLTCNGSKIYLGNMEVLNITISKAEIDVLFYVSEYCGVDDNTRATLESDSYTISSKENKFVTVGSNSYGYFYVFDGDTYSTGCLTRFFDHQRSIDDGTCSGVGCCQVDIPPRMWNISIEAFNFNNESDFCSYAFVVKNGRYNFSLAHLSQGFPFKELPVVLDWTIGNESCSTASNGVNYGCKKNSYCDDKDTYFGYRCHCNPGFEGNPYHPNGCTDSFP